MRIGFVGLGKLGMPCAEAMAERGATVSGYDIVPKVSEYIDIKSNIREAVEGQDIVFVATPTPHTEGYDGRNPTGHLEPRDFNYDAVIEVLKQCDQHMNKDQILVLISTVLPGTTRRAFDPLIKNTRFVYNPYLIAMGTVKADFLSPEMLIVGTKNGSMTEEANTLINFYQKVLGYFPRIETGTWEEAEAIKIFYNTFISTKIALVNMIQDVAQKLGNTNVDRVTTALANSTKRIISSKYMKAGMGDGGACHPRDNIALRWLSKELKLGYDLFDAVMTARERQAENMALEILKYGNNIHFTSDSYKPGTNLTDGSYSILVQYYVNKHGGQLVNGFDNPVEVIVRVHETDQFTTDDKVIIFDPWRTYPKADNVIYYGDTTKQNSDGKVWNFQQDE
jgi:UDPglucose 6-dehydrogenase